jgi:hypothetical protein
VASEGEEWKKYRKIAAPAFSEVSPKLSQSPRSEYDDQRNNKLVWDETNQIMMDLFDNVWGDRAEVVVDHCLDITLPVRILFLIPCPYPNISARLRCSLSASQVVFLLSQLWQSHVSGILGFGRQVTWTSDLVVPPGHQMTFKDALHILSSKVILKVVVPDWAMNLTEQTRKVHLAFTEMEVRNFRSPFRVVHVSLTPHTSGSNICSKWWKLAERQIKQSNDMICLVAFWMQQKTNQIMGWL